ncbi:MAG: dTDP-4-dehydrorhamnose reductase [Candidatus Eremiobacteraeota bacterium]|nr:dTDP-4-dehydrorhamnose reductase [Candidatus Eremiobacteraeota bacterium]
MKRVLVFGGSGQLGTEIRARWRRYEIEAPSHAEIDMENAGAVDDAIEQYAPDVVVNCTAFHNVDRCEDEPAKAFAANALAVDAVAACCERRSIRFVTISTDYVFSGDAVRAYREDDAATPISVYGASKLAGELLVRRRAMDAIVVRTCGVYGILPSASKGHTFVDRIIAQARAGERIRVVNDVVASPTYAGHLAIALERLAAEAAPGLYHAVNRGAVSWYDFARSALAAAELQAPVEPVPQSTWAAKARRPRFSALSDDRIGAIGIDMPDWQAGIFAYLTDKALRAASQT